ncbi:MAG: ABC transporter ATP-binding protein [Alphaproteobacteria bacterium]|nr:ABC transporter ATP-binding protein [Alphaproteobacteria bacterium]
MSKISLRGLRHSYLDNPANDADWALKSMDLDWRDGGAYALLGPSGCGKTTLLNIISGLVVPSEGQVLFGDQDVTKMPTDQRNIAQVFQFPVVYDTMTVYDNLAFPLRNRGFAEDDIDVRVRETAQTLDLEKTLFNRASGLTADSKQKISLGRGLIRPDVNAILFDEPLTVIDPHLKWVLRSKLKEIHRQVGSTMIYVTHDQTEALTFADKVVVIHDGTVVQIGTPIELFEKPKHTFVGHFIGSPGMNLLPCELNNGVPLFAGQVVETANGIHSPQECQNLEIGVRPEFVSLSESGIPVKVVNVSDTGPHRIVDTRHGDVRIKLLITEDESIPADNVHITFDPAHTQIYADGWLVSEASK